MTATLSLGLYGRAIVPMPKKARRRPVYGTATPLRCLMDIAHSFFRVQNIAHARLCQSLKEFHRNSALPPSPQGCHRRSRTQTGTMPVPSHGSMAWASVKGSQDVDYSCPEAFCLRTDQCCSVTESSTRLSTPFTCGTNSTALFTA